MKFDDLLICYELPSKKIAKKKNKKKIAKNVLLIFESTIKLYQYV